MSEGDEIRIKAYVGYRRKAKFLSKVEEKIDEISKEYDRKRAAAAKLDAAIGRQKKVLREKKV